MALSALNTGNAILQNIQLRPSNRPLKEPYMFLPRNRVSLSTLVSLRSSPKTKDSKPPANKWRRDRNEPSLKQSNQERRRNPETNNKQRGKRRPQQQTTSKETQPGNKQQATSNRYSDHRKQQRRRASN